jgi:probable HAF family extracellular repeat protein
MPMRLAIAAVTGVVVLLATTFETKADDKTLLIELDTRSEALPADLSDSGAVVAGGFNGGRGAFYWMPTAGTVFAGGVTADGVSGDGRTIVGWANDSRGIQQAAIWLRATEWRLLGSFGPSATPCDAYLSSATDVSRDGQVVVGYAYSGCTAHAFRWQESTGMIDLGSSVSGRPTVAHAVSADGSVVVGSQTSTEGFNQGTKWVDGRQELVPGPDGFVGTAMAANNDGAVIVGRICRPPFAADQSAWVWRPRNGTTCLPAPRRRVSPGPVIILEAAATSDDGQVIGGSQNVGGSVDSDAVIWIDGQPAYLKEFLQTNGVPDAFRTWVNTGTITGISPDGRILVGWGAALGGFRGYMVILGSSRVIPS